MMLLRARDNNIQSFAFIWLDKGNQNDFLKHPKIKWLDGDSNPQPLDCRSIALPNGPAGRAMDRQSRGWEFESPV